jgi:hypothetical protein
LYTSMIFFSLNDETKSVITLNVGIEGAGLHI